MYRQRPNYKLIKWIENSAGKKITMVLSGDPIDFIYNYLVTGNFRIGILNTLEIEIIRGGFPYFQTAYNGPWKDSCGDRWVVMYDWDKELESL